MSVHTPFKKFPEFTTERLFLRMVKETDTPYLFEIKADEEITAKYGREPHASIEQTSRWVDEILKDYVEKKDTLLVYHAERRRQSHWFFHPLEPGS